MKKVWLLSFVVMLMCMVGITQADPFQVSATVDVQYGNDSDTPATSRKDTSGLGIRNISAPRRHVSMARYDITAIKQPGKVFKDVILSIRCNNSSNKGPVSVFGIKESLDSYNLSSGSWSTAPGLPNSPVPPAGSPVTLDYADLSPKLLEFGTITKGTRITVGPGVEMDNFLNSDTDGILILVFAGLVDETSNMIIDPINYTGAGTGYMGSDAKEYFGVVIAGQIIKPTYAINPAPAYGAIVNPVTTTALSWTNPEPNLPTGVITCDVYFGTDPNMALTAADHYGLPKVASAAAGSSIPMPATLTSMKAYYWMVDIHDSTRIPDLTLGTLWNFNTNNKTPVVLTSEDQYIWLNNAGDPATAKATISGTATDDGLPINTLVSTWSQTGGPATAAFDPNTITTVVTLPQSGTYLFRLSSNDSDLTGFDDIQIVVANTPCLAAKAKPGYVAYRADFDGDCLVNLADLAIFAADWLKCNSLAPCY